MTDNRKTTVPGASVGADAVQSSDKITTNIITNSGKQINLQAAKKSNNFGLNTVSMTELYDTVYPPRKPIVNDLLYSGTYLFVGAPKVGKSFLMAQLAYHVSMGLPLWGYPVHKGTVLYLALEDDHRRLQGRLYRMFGMDGTNDLLFAISTSGNSKNIIHAATAAKAKGTKVIGLLGKDGGALKSLCDIPIIVPSSETERIQEVHITIVHILCELLETQHTWPATSA